MAKTRQQELYKQVEIERKDTTMREVCWIPSHLAEVGKLVHFKRDGFLAYVKEVYEVEKSLEEIEINRYNPLRNSTDI